MEAKHTPGPWTISGTPGTTMFVEGPDGPVLRIRGGMLPVDADARLIAAAPTMLDALRDAEHALTVYVNNIRRPETHTPGNSLFDDALSAVRSAIAKATGGGA